MSRCRFLRDDGTCGHDHDDDVREYCVEGPCSDYEELDNEAIEPYRSTRGRRRRRHDSR